MSHEDLQSITEQATHAVKHGVQPSQQLTSRSSLTEYNRNVNIEIYWIAMFYLKVGEDASGTSTDMMTQSKDIEFIFIVIMAREMMQGVGHKINRSHRHKLMSFKRSIGHIAGQNALRNAKRCGQHQSISNQHKIKESHHTSQSQHHVAKRTTLTASPTAACSHETCRLSTENLSEKGLFRMVVFAMKHHPQPPR